MNLGTVSFDSQLSIVRKPFAEAAHIYMILFINFSVILHWWYGIWWNHDKIVLLIETNMVIPSHSTSCYQMNFVAIEGLKLISLDGMAANLADDIFKCSFMNEKFFISIRISLKFVPRGAIDNRSALVQVMAWHPLVQVMAWHPTGDKSLPEPMLTKFTDIYVALRADESKIQKPTQHI